MLKIKKGVLVARYASKQHALKYTKFLNEEIKDPTVLFYIMAWIEGTAFPYAIIRIVDVEGED